MHPELRRSFVQHDELRRHKIGQPDLLISLVEAYLFGMGFRRLIGKRPDTPTSETTSGAVP
jgi:hypothetical protein